jgi:hypothetical protein
MFIYLATTNFKSPIAVTLAAAIVSGNVWDPQTFKDVPPLASVPVSMGSTLTGVTGPAYHPENMVRVDAVTDQQVRPMGPVGPSARAERPSLLPTGPKG